jgi:hypothetical protein
MQQLFRWAIAGVLLLSISACGTAPNNANNQSVSEGQSSDKPIEQSTPHAQSADTPKAQQTDKTADATDTGTTNSEQAPSKPIPQVAANSAQTEEVTLYRIDNQCQDYVAQKITISKADATDQIVGKVIENSNSPDFKIDNYRVRVENNTATIDLRLPPSAKRPFAAMSTCEQQSLLGSMQKTLTSNPNLKIQSVRFTDGKKELLF